MMSDKIKVLWIASLFLTAVTFGWLGVRGGRAEQNKWWLNRITGREFSVDGSLPREGFGNRVYCVSISESKEGFTALDLEKPHNGICPCPFPIVPRPPKKAKPAKCDTAYLKGYGDAIHWAMEANRKVFGVIREQESPAKEPSPCLVGQEKNRAQDVCCPAYLEVNDCSWHHGTNPRESAKP